MWEQWIQSMKGRRLLIFWFSLFISVSSYSFKYRRQCRTTNAAAANSESRVNTLNDKIPLKHILKILFKTNKVRISVILLAISIYIRLWVGVLISKQIGTLGSHLAKRQWKLFMNAQMRYALWTIPGAFLNAFVSFSESMLALSIRETLTEHAIQVCQLPNAILQLSQKFKDTEQRFTNDIEKLAEGISQIVHSSMRPIIETVMISYSLARMVGAKPLFFCYSYFVLAGTWSRFVMPSLKTLFQRLLECESTYKASHHRIQSHSEEIQFLQGSRAEARLLSEEFAAIKKYSIASNLQKLGAATLDGYVVRYLGILAALSTMVPALETRNIRDPTRYFLTCLHLLVNLMGAFKEIGVVFRAMSEASGFASRVYPVLDMHKFTIASSNQDTRKVTDTDVLECTNVSFGIPGSDTDLIKSLTFSIKSGHSVLLHGDNGIGKTSIFRVLAGLWHIHQGSIMISQDCIFLTARPYLVPNLSVRDQLLYPQYNRKVNDQEIYDAMNCVGLMHKFDSANILDQILKIENMSAGEKQRLACARLIIAKPKFACLDECTSFCTEEFEKTFLNMCIQKYGITLIVISHRQSIRSLFDTCLHVQASGVLIENSN